MTLPIVPLAKAIFQNFVIKKVTNALSIKIAQLYKNEGCSHDNGFLCDLPNCSMNKTYLQQNIQCPICGYYCLGKGSHGCIDKPSLIKL
jgi:hypothetical protein